ncbi:MAG TPA: adenylyl-sulfate kinase [Rhodocyclaceae bacterium]
MLRVILCGSAGDGKSSLIGCLSATLRSVPGGAAADAGSGRHGDWGFAMERHFLSNGERRFLIGDAPGHERHTRDMLSGASAADVAVVLIDASRGVQSQTRRHGYLISLIGVRHVIVAINKLDAVAYSREVFERIRAEYSAFAGQIGMPEPRFIPVASLAGDNITAPSPNMPWYRGPTLLACLEALDPTDHGRSAKPFRMPVHQVAGSEAKEVTGMLAGGTVRAGDEVRVLPSGRRSRVARIAGGQASSVTLVLEDAIDVNPGDLVAAADAPPEVSDQFEATLVWTGDEPMLPGRPYLMKGAARTVPVVCTSLKYKLNVNTLEHVAAKKLELNDIGVCNINLDQAIPFDPYAENRETGGFVIVDRLTERTVGVGMLHFALRRSHNIHWQAVEVSKDAHAALKGQKPCILWFTGLSGSGKSTIANLVEKMLHAEGRHTYLLDGDNVRHGLNKDLGFTEADRVENIRRVAEVAKLMVDAGLIVLVSFISPFRAERRMARTMVKEGEFIEVFVDTPLAVAEQRDPKGLYEKARRGQLKNFTGIDSPYEAPEHPEMRLDTCAQSAVEAANAIVDRLRQARLI